VHAGTLVMQRDDGAALVTTSRIDEGPGLLAAYQAFGATALLEHTGGDYAGAIVDTAAGEVVLCRQGVAGVPLYWAAQKEHFAASTSRMTLLRLGFTHLQTVPENHMVKVSAFTWSMKQLCESGAVAAMYGTCISHAVIGCAFDV
jgi:asparagine synthetase B (glutamine-hydrolysing)